MIYALKRVLLLIVLTLSFLPSAQAVVDPNFYIFLCFGQSNMEGQGPIEAQDLTVDSRFQVMQAVTCTNQPANAWRTATPPIARCNTRIGPSDYFGREMIAKLPANIKIGIVHVSIAGSKIEIFDKNNYQTYLSSLSSADQYIVNIANQYGGNPYAKLVALAKLAQNDGVIKGILLHQGESNTGDQAWPTKVNGVYKNLLTDLGLTANNVPLLAGQVVDAAAGGICASMNTIINSLPNTIPTAHIISSSGLAAQSDNLHFTTASYRILGARYADMMLSLLPAVTANVPPTVSLTAPTITSFNAPASITITATAADADGSVVSVKFYNGTTLLSTVNASPYTYSWASVAAGTYSITAVATDNSGATTTSTVKSITVTGTTPPPPPTTSTVIGKCKGKYLGNILPGNVPSTYTTYWNQATSENGSKWGSVESSQGNYNFSTSDVSYNWAKNNGGLFKYHNFVWGSQTPGYIATASTATITASVENYIKACSTHYASMGGLKMIDVLNEPVNTAMPGNLKAALTAGYKADPANAADINNQYGWVIWPYQLARKYFPDAVLLINEYNVEMNWNSCRAPYLAMANAVKNAPNLTDGKKNLIDGVGLQCHGIDNLTAANFKACIDEIWTTTGLPTHITEFDQEANPNEAKQTAVYSSLIPVAWEHPHVAGITLWGYIQGTTWRNGNGTAGASGTDSGIMYANGTPRPAMAWLINYMAGQPSLSCCPAPAPLGSCTTSTGTPPTVAISAPLNNATYAVGASVIINATAADVGGSVTSVKFYNGTILLGTSTTSPYTYTWTNVAQGNYVITAVATDNSANITTSTAVNITVGNPVTSLINNGEFDNGTTGWTLQNNGGATGTMSVVTNGNLSGTNSLRICPSTTPGTLEWHVQVSEVTPIVTGKTYQISVMAKADAARTMSVAIQEAASPYTTYFAQTVNLTTTAQTFTFTYTSTVTDAAAQLKFYVGADVNCLNIDKISMTEGNLSIVPVITASGVTTFCVGGNVLLNANTGTGYTYQWLKDAAPISGATAGSYTANQSGSYTVSITANTQTFTSTATVVTVNTTPNVPTVTSPITYCQNANSTALTATGSNLLWYTQSIGGTGVTTAPTPTTSVIGTVNYYVSQTTTGCESGLTLIAVTVNALPTAAITTSGSTTFCTGGSVMLSSSGGSSYVWKNGTTQVGTAASYSAITAGSYTVEVTNSNTCKATSTAIVVTVNTTPNTPAVTSPVTYCQNANALALTATGTSLLWYTSSTGGTGSTTAQTPITTATGTTNYYVSQTNGCESSRALIAVTVNALPTAIITTSGSTTFCTGGSVMLSSSGGSSYVWKNGTTQVGTGASYSAITAGSYTVEVTNSNTCKATSAGTVVTVNATPNTPAVTSPVTYCQNANSTALTPTGTSLLWYTSSTGGTGSTTAPIPITTATGTTNYYVTQTNGCESARALIAVTVNALPTAAITTSGSTTFCTGGSVILSSSGGSSYVWKNGTTQVGTGASYSAITGGSYTVEVTNSNTCKATSAATTVTINATSTAPIVTSSVSYCQNASSTALTATGTSLLWYTSSTGGTGITTAPTPITTATGTTNYYVSQTNGCESSRALIAVTINESPLAVITASSSTTIPAGGSVVLNANSGTGLGYVWYQGNTQVGTGISYTATAVGVYTVEVTNGSNCITTSGGTNVNVNTNQPSIITITSPTADAKIPGAITIAVTVTDPDGSISKVEYLDGTKVIGTSTSAPYIFNWTNPSIGSHVITVRVTDSNGGITTSAPVTITSVSTTTAVQNATVVNASVYPNPSNAEMYIESDMDLLNAHFTAINVLGEEILLSSSSNLNGARIDISNLSEGTYILIVTKGTDVLRKKITVIR
jgi:GH35 family endo-1,4-beta-xylanase